jgi:hypothetical protein
LYRASHRTARDTHAHAHAPGLFLSCGESERPVRRAGDPPLWAHGRTARWTQLRSAANSASHAPRCTLSRLASMQRPYAAACVPHCASAPASCTVTLRGVTVAAMLIINMAAMVAVLVLLLAATSLARAAAPVRGLSSPPKRLRGRHALRLCARGSPALGAGGRIVGVRARRRRPAGARAARPCLCRVLRPMYAWLSMTHQWRRVRLM